MDNKDNKQGYVHSIKVPKTYREVAKIIKKVMEDGLGLKDSVYNNNTDFKRNNQRNLALASKILQNSPQLEHVLQTTQILTKEPRLDPWLSRVLIYELLWRKNLDHQSKPIQCIISYKNDLNDALNTFKEDNGTPIKKVIIPRYARVNTIKKSVSDVIAQLRDEGMIFLPSFQNTYSEYLDTIKTLQQDQMMLDYHIKEMLVFSPSFCFATHEFFKDGVLIFQDKASCLAPLLLNPTEGSVVLDMCAAPGMKTNYLANLVGKKGHVYAVERSQRRYQMMSELLTKQGLTNIDCIFEDATKLKTEELADVEFILVDPSCSGSGILNRIDHVQPAPGRLESLAYFQWKILNFALNKFPNVKRVVYSTCSINPEENEEVVSKVLEYNRKFELENLQEKMKSNWNHFGSDKYGIIGTSCLYTNPEKDLTNGFFVAVFNRIIGSNKKRKNLEQDCFYENNKNKQTKTYDENTVEIDIESIDIKQEPENNDMIITTKKKKEKSKKKLESSMHPAENSNEENVIIKKENEAEYNIEINFDCIVKEENFENEHNDNKDKVKSGKLSKKKSNKAKRQAKRREQYEENTKYINNIKMEKTNNDEDNSNHDIYYDLSNSVNETISEKPKKKKDHKKSKKKKELDSAEMFL